MLQEMYQCICIKCQEVFQIAGIYCSEWSFEGEVYFSNFQIPVSHWVIFHFFSICYQVEVVWDHSLVRLMYVLPVAHLDPR